MRESKWEDKLGQLQGVPFWDRCYKNTSLIFFDNRVKWLQYQIVRGTLKTNAIISKFIPNIGPRCTFCDNDSETLLHLFWNCPIVYSFLREISEQAHRANILYVVEDNVKKFLFCNGNTNVGLNFIFKLYLKYYIWITRCKKNILNVDNFFEWYNKEVNILKLAYPDTILSQLSRIN